MTERTPPFTVTGPTSLGLDAARRGTGSFAVSNVTGRPVRARVLVLPAPGTDAGWLRVTGDAEIALPLAGTAAVDVEVSVPGDVPAGSASFQLGVALEEAPDQVVHGPTTAFEIPAATKRRFPWWIVIVAAVAVLLLIGGGILIWQLTRPQEVAPTPSAEPTQPPRPVFTSGEFTFQSPWTDVDLETGTVTAGIRTGADVSLSDTDFVTVFTSGIPLSIYGYSGGVAIVERADFETCRAALLLEFVDVPDGAPPTAVCTVTSDNRIAMLQITASTVPGEHSTREIAYTVWE